MDKGKTERRTYCDYLRMTATLAVVVLHASSSNWNESDFNIFIWKAFNFFDSIVRWGVPVFIMISGSLFLGRKIHTRTIYTRYILRMIIAFLFWNVFYVLTSADTFENGIILSLKTNLGSIFSGHYHMWFILTITGLYMCIPIYNMIITNRSVMKYFLILSFLFTYFFPWISKILDDFAMPSNKSLSSVIQIFSSNINTMKMNLVLGYSFYFIIGYYLDNTDLRKPTRFFIYCLGISGFIFTILADWHLTEISHQPCSRYYGVFDVNILCEAICIHTLFKYHEYKHEQLNKLLAAASAYTFGAYLIHPFFLDKLSSVFGFDTLSFTPVLSVPVISLVVFTMSICTSFLLHFIPGIKKYCV